MANKKLNPILEKFKVLRTKRSLVIILSALAILLALFLGKSLFWAALVNGRPVSRLALIKELEAQGGSKVLDSLIEKSLISQEAAKQGVRISRETLDAEIARIEDILKEQNLTLEEALEARGETRASLVEQIRLQKTIEAILGDKVEVTDEEAAKYFEENKDLYGEVTFADAKDSIREQLIQNKLSEEYSKWIEELRQKAKIFYLVDF